MLNVNRLYMRTAKEIRKYLKQQNGIMNILITPKSMLVCVGKKE